jgi:hypothetical protein
MTVLQKKDWEAEPYSVDDEIDGAIGFSTKDGRLQPGSPEFDYTFLQKQLSEAGLSGQQMSGVIKNIVKEHSEITEERQRKAQELLTLGTILPDASDARWNDDRTEPKYRKYVLHNGSIFLLVWDKKDTGQVTEVTDPFSDMYCMSMVTRNVYENNIDFSKDPISSIEELDIGNQKEYIKQLPVSNLFTEDLRDVLDTLYFDWSSIYDLQKKKHTRADS